MNLANKITVFRIILAPFFIASILYSKESIALGVFLLAFISDGLDGYIARKFNQKTTLGAMLDPIADKIIIISAFVCFAAVKGTTGILKIPIYVPIIVISRDAILFVGALLIHTIKGNIALKPSYFGKITTFLQMLTVVLVLMQFKQAPIIWNVMILFTVISCLHYIAKGSKLLGEKA
ncbi:MAG: CDP-alcohol phosphatidyltransferase family protein [Candidatus Omnitrophica bacterium]|nr:CDP-alcohol phosphatidyltransferase family protein [Candidatus Omnitrophota bacterium]